MILHRIMEHEWPKRPKWVRYAKGAFVLWIAVALCAWCCTFAENNGNHGGSNLLGLAICGVCTFSAVGIVISIATIWDYEEHQLNAEKERAARIAALEAEVLDNPKGTA